MYVYEINYDTNNNNLHFYLLFIKIKTNVIFAFSNNN